MVWLQTDDLLRRRIRQQKVFLALDNVWQESTEPAKVYLRAGFHRGSIVLVTARSLDILGHLNIERSDCMEMPEFEEEDAKQLFLHHAAPTLQFLSKDDEQNIQYCIRQCQFRKGANMKTHFHPLALKVLGAQLGSLGCDPSIWVENIFKDDKFNQFQVKDHPIFSILRRGYDSLCEKDQLLFMDGVLFHPAQRSYWSCQNFFPTMDEQHHFFPTAEERHIFQFDMYEWLSIVHESEVRLIKERVRISISDSLNYVFFHMLECHEGC